MSKIESITHEKASDTGTGESGGQGSVQAGSEGGGKDGGGVSEGVVGGGVVKEKFIPKGTSITLYGCGRRDGSDVNNSMGLVDFYALMLGVAP